MERQKSPKVGGRPLHELLLCHRFRLRPGPASRKDLRARLLRGALSAPPVAKVPVQIGTGAAAASDAAAILAPQPIGGVRVLVAIRIGHRQHVPVNVAHILRLIVPVLGELVDDVGDRGRADPFARMDAAVQPDGRIAGIAVGDAGARGW